MLRPMVMAEGQWSIDIERAWANLFRLIVQQMSRAYADLEVATFQNVLKRQIVKSPIRFQRRGFPARPNPA